MCKRSTLEEGGGVVARGTLSWRQGGGAVVE